jgi:hypothetical protein
VRSTTAAITGQYQITTVPTPSSNIASNYSCKILGAATAAAVTLGQRVSAKAAKQNMSLAATYLSFWAYNKAGGTIAPAVLTFYPSGADTWNSGTANAQLGSTNATLLVGNAATDASWTQWGCAIPASSNYATGAEININFGSLGATYWVAVAQAQLEIGSSATTMEVLPEAPELVRCQYRYKRFGAASFAMQFNAYASTSAQYLGYSIPFFPPMASTPTMTKVGTWTLVNCLQPSLQCYGNTDFMIYSTSSATGLISFYCTDATCYIEATCDL